MNRHKPLILVNALAALLLPIVPSAATSPQEGNLEPFLGNPVLEAQDIFNGERFPNVVVALDGTVVATWGKQEVRVRRSRDGGQTWGAEIHVGAGIHAGGAIVDEKSGDLLLFTHPKHPPTDGEHAPRTLFRSKDSGRSWEKSEATFKMDTNGYLPSLHMAEHGITLRHGEHAGRLVRPARVYRRSPERYSTAIFSNNGGQDWIPSSPLPIQGAGEGSLLELSDGQLVYTARRSYFAEGQEYLAQRHYVTSGDGGQTWQDPSLFKVIPDGPRYRGKQKQGSNYNGHFGMISGFVRLPIQGRDILLYSNADHDGHERVKMTVWASFDGGATWPVKRLVDGGMSAYSSLATGRPGTASEGKVFLQYEYGEGRQQYAGCRIARFNLSWVLEGEMTGDGKVPCWVTQG
jgi:sialidase-1